MARGPRLNRPALSKRSRSIDCCCSCNRYTDALGIISPNGTKFTRKLYVHALCGLIGSFHPGCLIDDPIFFFSFFCNLLENWNNNWIEFLIFFCNSLLQVWKNFCRLLFTLSNVFSLFFFFFEEVKEGCSMEKIISRFRLVLGESSVLF